MLRRKTTFSLYDETKHIETSVRIYTTHKLGRMRQRLHGLGMIPQDTKHLENTIVEKSEGAYRSVQHVVMFHRRLRDG